MFSRVEAVILLAQILNRFAVAVEPCTDVRPIALGTMRPSGPIPVTITPRAANS